MTDPIPDPASRAFAPFTDPETLPALLQAPVQKLWGAPLRIVDCEVAHAWRKTFARETSWPKSFLRVCYSLQLSRAPGEAAFSGWLHGLARLDDQDADQGTVDAAATLRTGAAMLTLRRFPDDPALPQLALLAEPTHVASRLVALGLIQAGDAAVQVEVLRYRPGERCSLGVSVCSRDDGRAIRFFAKTYRDDTGALAHWRLQQLSGAGPQDLVARPLQYDPALKTVWQAWIDGARADEPMARDAAVRLVPRALATLHGSQITVGASKSRATVLSETCKRAAKLRGGYPALGALIDEATRACVREEACLRAAVVAPVHGDVHLEQFLLTGRTAIIVDLDELCEGEPEQDLASLLVDMRLRDATRHDQAPWCDAALRSYADGGHGTVRPDVLQWYLRLQCIAKAYRMHWKGSPPLEPWVSRVLRWAVEVAPSQPFRVPRT